MRLVSWNVAGHRDGPKAPRLTLQADAIASERPDLVALQEVTRAARSLRVLMDYLDRHPESLIRGKAADRP